MDLFDREDYEEVEKSDEDKSAQDDNGDATDYADADEASRGDCRLQQALRKRKSIEILLELIKSRKEVRHQNKLGDYPLHTACEAGEEETATKLIKLFPEAVHHKNLKRLYPLHVACLSYHGHIDFQYLVLKLIRYFPDAVSESIKGGSALHLACNRKLNKTVIRKLIEADPLQVAIQTRDNKGNYPIHCAIITDRPIAVIKLLLDNDPLGTQRKTAGRSNKDVTPLHLCCELDYKYDEIRYLLERSDLLINIGDIRGKAPIHYACRYLDDEIVDMLLQHPDIDVNATDNSNDTPLHTLLKYYHNDKKTCLEVLQKFIDHPKFILINQKNNKNKTPLDLMKDHLNKLETHKRHKSLIDIIEKVKEVISLLEEALNKERWQLYYSFLKPVMKV